MSVNIKDVEYVAKLARLEFNEEEKIKLVDELNMILEFAERLSEVDTDGIETSAGPYTLFNVLRDDEINESLNRDAVLRNAPDAKEGYFRVPRVID